MRIKFLPIFTVIILLSCNGKQETSSPAEQLTGEWNNLSIKVDINSKHNSDTNEVYEVSRSQWEEKLKIKPIRTFFRADSTWNSDYYNLEDSLVGSSSGKWWIEGEKLVWLQQFPSADTTVYSFGLEKDTASFECLLDWDSDGRKDDKYSGRQVKLSSSKK